MPRPPLEVATVFRQYGPDYRRGILCRCITTV
jgi:hypothetical protein